MCKQGGCGLTRLNTKVCIIIRQNGPEERFNSEKWQSTKSFSERCSTLEIAEISERDQGTIKHFVAKSQQGHKEHAEKKNMQIDFKGFEKNQVWSYQDPINVQFCHIP